MKKLISACAVCAVAVGVVAAPSALGVKSTKQVATSVDVSVTPTTATTGSAVKASGTVSSNSNCRKDRAVELAWVDTTTSAETPAGTASTNGSGKYRADLVAPATAGTYTLKATVTGPVTRKVGSKKKGKKAKKGRQFSCLASPPASSAPVTVTAPV
jgi:starvation-inducible outer membrane lipoprotein